MEQLDLGKFAAGVQDLGKDYVSNGKTVLETRGPFVENDISCTPPAGVNGTAQNESSGASRVLYNGALATGSCTNFYGIRINPSDTANIRINSKFSLTDQLTLQASLRYADETKRVNFPSTATAPAVGAGVAVPGIWPAPGTTGAGSTPPRIITSSPMTIRAIRRG